MDYGNADASSGRVDVESSDSDFEKALESVAGALVQWSSMDGGSASLPLLKPFVGALSPDASERKRWRAVLDRKAIRLGGAVPRLLECLWRVHCHLTPSAPVVEAPPAILCVSLVGPDTKAPVWLDAPVGSAAPAAKGTLWHALAEKFVLEQVRNVLVVLSLLVSCWLVFALRSVYSLFLLSCSCVFSSLQTPTSKTNDEAAPHNYNAHAQPSPKPNPQPPSGHAHAHFPTFANPNDSASPA